MKSKTEAATGTVENYPYDTSFIAKHLYCRRPGYASIYAEQLDRMIFDFIDMFGTIDKTEEPAICPQYICEHINYLRTLRNLFVKTAIDNAEEISFKDFGSFKEYYNADCWHDN